MWIPRPCLLKPKLGRFVYLNSLVQMQKKKIKRYTFFIPKIINSVSLLTEKPFNRSLKHHNQLYNILIVFCQYFWTIDVIQDFCAVIFLARMQVLDQCRTLSLTWPVSLYPGPSPVQGNRDSFLALRGSLDSHSEKNFRKNSLGAGKHLCKFDWI